MKFNFEPNLDYQQQAINSICDIFKGQEICQTEFTVSLQGKEKQMRLSFDQTERGVGNRLKLLNEQVISNVSEVQLRNGLKPTEDLISNDFTVEMETGTGKTYVYLRTLFELNRQYGFTKFVIVVPSVAIKEGVYKSLQMMEDHFRNLYANVPFDYFLYDSKNTGQIRNFATSSNIQIMVVTVGAINKKDVNNLYKENEKTGGDKPIELIKETRPILIVDEPQSVDGGMKGKGKEALEAMAPLCTLRYSATHTDEHYMVYRLDAIDAYDQKLVKQIEVAAGEVDSGFNKPYVRLESVSNKKGVISAKIEADLQQGKRVVRKSITVQDGYDLEEETGRSIYEGFSIGEIRVEKGSEFIELRMPGRENFLQLGQAVNDVDNDSLKRKMIQKTIKEHLEKEKRLTSMGIKVLSLFFIDNVQHYRSYDENGKTIKGKYATMFEEEYRRLAKHPDYNTLFKDVDIETDAIDVHNGYFAIDKKVVTPFDEVELKKSARAEDVETSTYNLIMKDKEKLLSFDTKLKFIFSHSALREGWDNPNVFQICSLREIGSERERRQTIGRGLRLCVNQQGERIRGFDVNTLTVIANESFEEYAENLQKEIEKDTGIRFGIVEKHQFATVSINDSEGNIQPLGVAESEKLWEFLKDKGYLDNKGKVQDSLRTDLKEKTVEIPESLREQSGQITAILRKLSGKLEIKNADDRKPIKTREAILESEEFKALWNRIKYKTTYRVQFDNEKLINDCIEAIQEAPPISKTRLQFRTAALSIGKGGVEAEEVRTSAPEVLTEDDIELPDIITELQDKTQLTRKSIVRILKESDRLRDFKRNPQQFIEMTVEQINQKKRLALVNDGIRYKKLGDEQYYAQELFKSEELMGYLKNTVATEKCVHERVLYDSAGIEKTFAEDLEKNTAVKVYAKLPGWFKIPTPLGSYNPDWAVLIEQDGTEKLYLVVETKASLFLEGDLRGNEAGKIKCGEKHFEALAVEESPAKYIKARNLDDVFAHC